MNQLAVEATSQMEEIRNIIPTVMELCDTQMRYVRKYVSLKEAEKEEAKIKEEFEMKVLLRKTVPMDIIKMRPQTYVLRQLMSIASKYQEAT